MDALPAEECMEDDMPMNSPMDPTTPPRTDDEPAAECMEEVRSEPVRKTAGALCSRSFIQFLHHRTSR